MASDWASETPDRVLDLWFPADLDDTRPEARQDFWETRMRGGMDAVICRDFAEETEAAARGRLNHWAATPEGHLALILTLDQFPRSYWRDTPGAYAQDIKAARLALEGIANGHYDALDHPFKRQFYIICISHCEGPDHLARTDMLVTMNEALEDWAPDHLKEAAARATAQAKRVRGIIAHFGRHPHRNPILGRVSTPEEEAYIAVGDFPHVAKVELPKR